MAQDQAVDHCVELIRALDSDAQLVSQLPDESSIRPPNVVLIKPQLEIVSRLTGAIGDPPGVDQRPDSLEVSGGQQGWLGL